MDDDTRGLEVNIEPADTEHSRWWRRMADAWPMPLRSSIAVVAVVVLAAGLFAVAPAGGLGPSRLDVASLTGPTPASAAADPTEAKGDPFATPPGSLTTPAQLPPVTAPEPAWPQRVAPLRGEGMIHLVKRVCGHADNWYPNAAANNIAGPAYVVPLDASLAINCTLPPQAPPAPPAQPAPAQRQAAPSGGGGSGWVKPVGGCLVPGGSRMFGNFRGDHYHGGVDLGGIGGVRSGDPIRAVHSGVAHHGYQAGGAGVYVWVDHGDGTTSWYFHMSSRAVGDGARVSAGQVIGFVGSTGNATGPHLHFETKVNGGRQDPVQFLSARGVNILC